MKKKILSLILSAIMILSLTACGKGQVTENNNEIEKQSVAEATTEVNAVENIAENEEELTQETKAPIVYDYEQELNVIDDNYRNYYEIFVYSFYDSDGDGIGDLNGVTQKLDYIKDMGFNGIWLMPIMQSPTYHKYDAVDYMSVDEKYGTIEDFEKLAEECHKRDIRLIIDYVINHTSSQHEWFVTACDYLKSLPEDKEPDLKECPYVDYYHFSREKVNGDYYQVGNSNWYYEGVFWSEMPDLNLSSKAVRSELEKTASFWMEKGVDGFRMDAAMHYEENDTNYNTDVMNWIFSYCKAINPDFYMVAEVWSNKSTIADYYASEIPSMFNFDAADAEGKIIKAARGNFKAASFVESMTIYNDEFGSVYSDYIDAPFITNHDQSRVANVLRKDENDMKMACGLLMSMNGSPFVYYGEEIGMCSSGKKDENKRLPMVWSETDMSGITVGPEAADKNIEQVFGAVDEQLKDEHSLLNYYKRAVRLRNENPEIARGEISIVEGLTEEHIAVITKEYDGNKIAIVYNTSDEEMTVKISDSEIKNMAIRGYLTLDGEIITLENGEIAMPAQSICILK